MNGKYSACIRSLRLRTLPLSLAGVCLGTMLATADGHVSLPAAVMIFLTTIFLQILSNLSNELGDALSGTDTPDRQGPEYGLGSGIISVKDLKTMIDVTFILCIVSGLVMIKFSFGSLLKTESVCLMILGAAAIAGAMRYTLGKHPYGYRGLGDLAVFLFFGLVAVLGAYFVAARTLPPVKLLLPAASIGFFSVGVLNVNNIRDMKTDAANRVTVALKMGLEGARIYQTVLIALGWVTMLVFCSAGDFSPWHFLFVLTLPLYVLHLNGIWHRTDRALDPMLPLLVMSTFAFALLAGAGFLLK